MIEPGKHRLWLCYVRLSTINDYTLPVAGPCLWNALPLHITSAPSLCVFHNHLNTSLEMLLVVTLPFVIDVVLTQWFCVISGHFNCSFFTYWCRCRNKLVTWRWKIEIWRGCCYVRVPADMITVQSKTVYGVRCHFVNEDIPTFVLQVFVRHWQNPQVRQVTCQPPNFRWSTVSQTWTYQVNAMC